MKVPCREKLEEEMFALSIKYSHSHDINKNVATILAACELSFKYEINIHKLLWTMCGIKRNNILTDQIKSSGILFHES